MSRVFILEDNDFRISWFKSRFMKQDLHIATTIENACETLLHNEFDIIFLDHDLGGKVYVDSRQSDTGYQVVKFMIANNLHKSAQIIIHSLNFVGAKMMKDALEDAEYRSVIVPFNLLDQVIEENNENSI